MVDVETLLVEPKTSIRSALQRLEASGLGILLVIDDQGRLQRTVTDGDLRRLLISDIDIESSLNHLPEHTPITLREDEEADHALELMEQYLIDHIPVVNREGKPIHLFHRRQFSNAVLLSTPHMGIEEYKFVAEAFATNWIAPLGPNVDAFEKEIADFVGLPAAAAVSSGTAALHVAMNVLGVSAGDTVFCSSLTFVASANPILYQQATPVFIDSEPYSWNMSPLALARAFEDAQRENKLPKAVVIVNLYGQSADYRALKEITQAYGVPVIEDAAESLGARYEGRASGSFGDIGIFSFNGNKIITTSGGGMLVSPNPEWMHRARFLSTQAREAKPYYEHTTVGYNYRMSNVLAGIGRGQLQVLNDRVASRRAVFERYQQGLEGLPGIGWMPEFEGSYSTRWLSAMTLHPRYSRVTPTEFIAALAKHKIEARHVWKPMHLQPLFQGCRYYPHKENHNVSDELFAQGICLPSGSNLKISDQERVIDIIRETLKPI